MTPSEIKSAREILGLSKTKFAEALRLGHHGRITVRRWEAGEIQASGPVFVAIEYLLEKSKKLP